MVLLVRDPRDVAVSQFFQWRYRMRPAKKYLNDYPPHGAAISLYEFVLHRDAGLPRIVEYYNGWVESLERRADMLLVRYEEMRADPARELGRILAFTGTPAAPEELREAVEFASYENMKRLEAQGFFRRAGSRVRPADEGNPESYKVRRAKVGGWRDYFDDEQCRTISALMADLHPTFGYRP
ncbi:MAG: hypothetical protein KatS3mg124_0359 [Porticoccaceae bacterium]|nr:MAG: hypothetical protein KatS3mg124_0359 [Porticoccaceae bacterium]